MKETIDSLKDIINEQIDHNKNKISYFKKLYDIEKIYLDEIEYRIENNFTIETSIEFAEKSKFVESLEYYIEHFDLMNEYYSEFENEFNLEEIEDINIQMRDFTKNVDSFYFKLKFDDKDRLNCIISIKAGAGGTEAEDWCSMLYRMYLMFAENNGFKIEELYKFESVESSGNNQTKRGLKKVEFIVSGENAFGFFKCEDGTHRLVRNSPYNSKCKRQTSFSTVKVTPQIDDKIEIDLNENEIEEDTLRGSGSGGQHKNKTDSAVRLRHIPTGIIVFIQNDRSQHRNRKVAREVLKSRLYELELKKREKENSKEYKEQSWGTQIRSYYLHPLQRIKDHRTNYEEFNFKNVIDGKIENFIFSFLEM